MTPLKNVLTEQPGQCVNCASKVTRILVQYGTNRRWQAAGRKDSHAYYPHQCPQDYYQKATA